MSKPSTTEGRRRWTKQRVLIRILISKRLPMKSLLRPLLIHLLIQRVLYSRPEMAVAEVILKNPFAEPVKFVRRVAYRLLLLPLHLLVLFATRTFSKPLRLSAPDITRASIHLEVASKSRSSLSVGWKSKLRRDLAADVCPLVQLCVLQQEFSLVRNNNRFHECT